VIGNYLSSCNVWPLLCWALCHGDLIDGTSNTRAYSKFWCNRQVCLFVLSVPISSFSAFWSLENIYPIIVQLPNQTILIRVSVFANLLSWYDVWNIECFILPGWKDQTCNRTMLPNPNIKGIVSSVHFCRVFPYVHFQCFGELKTRFLHIDPFSNIMYIVDIFDVWKIIIEM